jgi:poly(ADP-ribose) glycohydrolase ARH3
MSMDVAECLVENGEIDQDNLARRFAESYHWSRGYGPGAAKILRKIRDGADWREVNRGKFPEGSFGNGGAMRAPVIGLAFCGDDAAIVENVRKSCEITHPNPLAIQGATLVALATAWRLEDKPVEVIMRDLMAYVTLPEFRERLEIAAKWLEASGQINLRKIRKRLGNKITAHQSSVTAIYFALRCKDMAFRKMIRYIIRLKGDTDTIAAMAGAIWGAGGDYIADGQLNPKIVEDGQKMVELAAELHQFSGGSQAG